MKHQCWINGSFIIRWIFFHCTKITTLRAQPKGNLFFQFEFRKQFFEVQNLNAAHNKRAFKVVTFTKFTLRICVSFVVDIVGEVEYQFKLSKDDHSNQQVEDLQ